MYKKPSGLTHFLKANFDGTLATPLDAQESFRLKSFAIANALIVIAEETTQVNKGDLVEVHLLP
jgi:molybdopterin molybdotransferase